MENSIYLGLSRQIVLQNNMDIVANNVANVNTPGYRGQNTIFREYISDPRGKTDPDDRLSFVYDYGDYQITDPGPLSFTGNPYDAALEGPGFFTVIGPGGKPAYTRAGNFEVTADGRLVTAAGFAVSSGGGPVNIPNGSTEIKIDEKGVISNQDGPVGQIAIAEFKNIQTLKPIGGNLYSTDEAPLPAENTRISQGQLEGSNVQPVVEITRMIETLRSFQSMQQVLQTENERLRTAIQRLTRQS